MADTDTTLAEAENAGSSALWSREIAKTLYVDCGMTFEEIADHVGCGVETVGRWLERHDIRPRERPTGPQYDNRVARATFYTDKSGYERAASESYQGNSIDIVAVHRLIAASEWGLDAIEGKHVHHQNGIPWDNRPENLEPLSPSEHGKRHAKTD